MDVNSQISFDFWMIIVGVVVVLVVGIIIVFIAGYFTGSVRTRQMMENVYLMRRERQLRRLIRMQAIPKPKAKRQSGYVVGYYPATQARRNQAKYRRIKREQAKMRDK